MSTPIISGATYRLINAQAGNVMDLSGGDNTSLIGYVWHDGSNQKWELTDTGSNEWVFKTVAVDGEVKTLYIEDSGNAKNATPIIASVGNQTAFNILPDDVDSTVYRVFLPGTTLNFDLSDLGNPTNGTPIFLWDKWTPGKNQCWQFDQVDA